MENQKIIIVFIFIFISINLKAQEHDIPRKGFCLGTATLQYGLASTKNLSATYYMTLRGEYFLEKNVSLAGNLDFSLPKKFQFNDILVNHCLLFGVNYHFIKKHFDAYIGFQPGVCYTKSTIVNYDLMNKDKHVFSPLISSTIGARYYLGWMVHIFTSVSYQYGIQLSNQTNIPLSEFKFAAGVGININTLKLK